MAMNFVEYWFRIKSEGLPRGGESNEVEKVKYLLRKISCLCNAENYQALRTSARCQGVLWVNLMLEKVKTIELMPS